MRAVIWILRFAFRVLVAPIVIALTVLVALCTFLLAISGVILGILSVLVFLMAVGMLLIPPSTVTAGIVFMIIAFLISPFGLPRVAGWLIMKIDDLNGMLKFRVYGR